MRKIMLWIVVGLVATLACLFGYFKVQNIMNPYVPFDPFGGSTADIGYIPDNAGITYVLSEQVIGDTDFIVQLAGSRKDNQKGPSWDYYLLQVSRLSNINDVERRHPYFVRCYKASFFSAEFNSSTFEDFLTFNAEKRVLSFDFGFTNITCKLPNLGGAEGGSGSEEIR